MHYIKYAYIALGCWGVWAIGTKLLSHHLNAFNVSFWVSLWMIVPLAGYFFVNGGLVVNAHSFYAIPVGLISLVAVVAFYQALRQGPSSVVLPLTNLYVVIPAVFGFVVLKEAITWNRVAGIVLAVLGAVLLSR